MLKTGDTPAPEKSEDRSFTSLSLGNTLRAIMVAALAGCSREPAPPPSNVLLVNSIEALTRNFQPSTLSSASTNGATVTYHSEPQVALNGQLKFKEESIDDRRAVNPLYKYEVWGTGYERNQKISEFVTPWHAPFMPTNAPRDLSAQVTLILQQEPVGAFYEYPRLPEVTLSHGGKLSIKGIFELSDPSLMYAPKAMVSADKREHHVTFEPAKNGHSLLTFTNALSWPTSL